MRIVDANVLLYAVNTDARHHAASREWLNTALGGADRVGFDWIVGVAFLRLATSRTVFPSPLSTAEALDQLGDWMAAPGAVVLHPTPAHLAVMAGLLEPTGAAGNLINDAHIASLAIEHRAEVVSYDNDFARFPGVPWRRPNDLLARIAAGKTIIRS